MSPPEPALKLSDRKREAIVEAAVAQFREQGFGGTSMDGIAAAAGVSKRTVYNHFPSKDELFAAILRQLWERSTALGEAPYDPQLALRPQLLALLRQKLDLMNDGSFLDLVRVAVAEMMHTPERAQAMVARLGEKEEGLAGWIRAAQAHGRLRTVDPAYAAHQLQGLLKAFAFWPQLAMGQAPLTPAEQQRVLDDSVDMFLGFYAT
jgi:TetR/AcrR family transcriptional regulator of autoinduction and epiphytic fitness